jgi:hypothetical protein
MRWSNALVGLSMLCLSSVARGDDRPWLERFVSRTPYPHHPPEHTMERAGYPLSVSRCARASITQCDYAGYVGGASLCNNNLCARGPGSATGPLTDGTYATDYAGVRANLGRLFLAPSTDPSSGRPIYLQYRAEGPRVPDPLALRPLRNAVLAAREAKEERVHGGEHGGGEHGGENGPAPETGEGKGE